MGVDAGSRITFIVENGSVRMVNSAVYAMETLCEAMEGEAEKVGLHSEEDVVAFIKQIRREG